MRLKTIAYLSLFVLISCLVVEQTYTKNICYLEKNNMEEQLEVFDFWKLYSNDLPKSSAMQPVDNIAKILFYELIDTRSHNKFAIDIERRKMQISPSSVYLQGGKEFNTNLS